MTLDWQSGATVDHELTSLGGYDARRTIGRERARRQVLVSASTLDQLVISPAPYEVVTDADEFAAWLSRTRGGALLDVIARSFARAVDIVTIEVRLESELDDPDVQHVHVIARTSAQPEPVLRRLFAFTDSPWWLDVARRTGGAFVVDVAFD